MAYKNKMKASNIGKVKLIVRELTNSKLQSSTSHIITIKSG